MIFIEKSDLDDYRFAVGKVIFLRVYRNEYRFIKDIENSNCMIVEDSQNRQLIIALFREPTIGKKKKVFPILVFLQSSKQANKNDHRILSEEFNALYDKNIILAILQPNEFLEEYRDYREIMFEIILNSFIAKDTTGNLFKYYSANTQNNPHNRLDGAISFMHPSQFNDPFDCTCLFANGNTVTNNIRVFCSIPNEKDILMWSYYGENHTGYCFEYSKHDIITELSKINNGICIMGKVEYSDRRPNYRLKTNNLSYTSIKKIIDCTFTKYIRWSHENEYRFVLITNNTNSIAFPITIPILNIYEGCKNNGTPLVNSLGQVLSTIRITDDPIDYRLN